MKKIIVIDNYDSFTYNLVHVIEKTVGHDITVKRNDEVSLEELEQYEYLVLSPGPGIPEEAGLLKEIIRTFAPSKKILGVCLGQQAIGEVFGAKLKNLDKVFHGVKTPMKLTPTSSILFDGISNTFEAGRYHSWVIERSTLPTCLQITAVDTYEEIMAIQHEDYKVFAVQFHPESILTKDGEQMIKNFLEKA